MIREEQQQQLTTTKTTETYQLCTRHCTAAGSTGTVPNFSDLSILGKVDETDGGFSNPSLAAPTP